MKTAFIINPIAGRGKTSEVWRKMESKLQLTHKFGDPYFTAFSGDAKRLAQELPDKGYRRLVIFGGDGTVNEVLNGLDLEKAQLGIVPTGTGNDFCRVLGIPSKPMKAVALLNEGRIRRVDIGLVNGRRFLNTVGVGFDAEVARTTNEEYKQLKGTLAYLVSVTKVLWSYRNEEMIIETEENTFEGKMLLAAIGNGRYIGGGMKLIPGAEIDNGLFHLCLLGDLTKTEILLNMPKIFSGTHLSHPQVSSLTARKVIIKSKNAMTVQADGEILGKTPIEVEIIPRVLEMIVPE